MQVLSIERALREFQVQCLELIGGQVIRGPLHGSLVHLGAFLQNDTAITHLLHLAEEM